MHLSVSLGAFYGIDSLIDFLIMLVAILISYQSHKVYKLIHQKSYQFFSWAFLSIAIAFAFKIIANLTIQHRVVIESSNFFLFIIHEFKEMQILHFTSFIAYKFFLLLGFLTLFLLAMRKYKTEEIFLFLYLSIIAILFSIYFNFVFSLTVIILLSYLTAHFYENYRKTLSANSRLVFIAFLFILTSNIIELFYSINLLFYLAAEIFIFIGFLLLLLNHIRVKNGKKKNEDRSNKRPVRTSEKK